MFVMKNNDICFFSPKLLIMNPKHIFNLNIVFAMSLAFCIITSCKKDDNSSVTDKATDLIFSPQDDKALGQKVVTEIESNPTEYPVLSEAANPVPYQHIKRIRDALLNSGKVKYKTEFEWTVKIIQKDSVLNAFCTPGGYIYVYTGLIKYLDTEDQLAGVLGHEIGHADLRHSKSMMITQFGIQLLLDMTLGKASQTTVAQISKSIVGLQFSKAHETESDTISVRYLAGTSYQCSGTAGFFEKLEAEGKGCSSLKEFFSTHPCPDNRIQNIKTKAQNIGCSTTPIGGNSYQEFKNSLP